MKGISFMYAIVKTGGKQYAVREKDLLEVEKLEVAAGENVTLESVLFVSGDKGSTIGTPVVAGAKVTAKVVRHGLGKKVVGFKYKAKKNVRRRYGHRQPHTTLQIEKIEYAG